MFGGDPCGILHPTELEFVLGRTEIAVLSFFLLPHFVLSRDHICLVLNRHASMTDAEALRNGRVSPGFT